MIEEPHETFLIERFNGITKITNRTDLDSVISIKPIKPKRKFNDILVIKRGSYIMLETSLDLAKVAISFVSNNINSEEENKGK